MTSTLDSTEPAPRRQPVPAVMWAGLHLRAQIQRNCSAIIQALLQAAEQQSEPEPEPLADREAEP